MNDLTPLVTVAAELGADPAQLAARLTEHIVVDADTGIRCLAVETVRDLVDQRAQQAERQLMTARRAQVPDIGGQLRARLRARAEAQRELAGENLSARDLMALTSGDPDSDLERAGRRHDELITAQRNGHYGTMHRFTPTRHDGA